jgi:N-acetylglucosamine malate deacetylase 1
MSSNLSRRDLFALGLPLTAQGADTTRADSRLKVVVVGGHPDDPESGCGGTMARYAQNGHDVVALYLTRGEAGISGKSQEEAAKIRTREAGEACRILGARPLFAGQIDGATEINRARYREFQEILAAERPDIVFAHWPVDTHPDHCAASLLTYRAWQAAARKWALYYYEVMSGSQTQNFRPSLFVNIAETVEKKRAACFAHKSQNPAEFWAHHEEMQRFRGMECKAKAAEAFVPYVNGPHPELP